MVELRERRRRVGGVVAALVVTGAIALALAEGAAPESAPAPDWSELFVPPNAEQIRIRFARDALPDWFVWRSGGEPVRTRELRIEVDRVVALTLQADDGCEFSIPSMRVQRTVPADRFQVIWFIPKVPGRYQAWVRVGEDVYAGSLLVEERRR